MKNIKWRLAQLFKKSVFIYFKDYFSKTEENKLVKKIINLYKISP